jgi:hypothetical protein
MTDKPKRNYYKTAWVIIAVITIPYFSVYGAINRADAFSEYWTGMSRHKADAIKGCAEHMPDITGGL